MSEKPPSIPPELEEKLSELEILRQALEESKQKTADFYDQLLRLKAEFENFRKRSEKEKSEVREWGKQEVLTPLLGIVDVFEQALRQATHAKDTKSIVQGLQFLHKNFEQLLKSEGLEVIEVLDKVYDPHFAEAIEQEEVDEDRVGKVLGELQKGYLFKGRVLRPSRVRVGVSREKMSAPSVARSGDNSPEEEEN